jgi:hypothetical protein
MGLAIAVVVAVVTSACAAPPAEDDVESGGNALSGDSSPGTHDFDTGTPGVAKSCGMSPQQLETNTACVLSKSWCRAEAGPAGAPCSCQTTSGWVTGTRFRGDRFCSLDEAWPKKRPGSAPQCTTPNFWCTPLGSQINQVGARCYCKRDGTQYPGTIE